MQVQQIMNRPPIVCHPEDTAEKAAGLMWDHDCGVVPIVDSDEKLKGIITDRDICMAAYTQHRPLHEIRVGNAMAKKLSTCYPEDSLDTAAARMKKAQVHRLPVVDHENHIVGVISTNDIFREVSGHRGQTSLSDRKLVETLAAICAPHRPVQLVERPKEEHLQAKEEHVQ